MLCDERPYGAAIAKTRDTPTQQRLSYRLIFSGIADTPNWINHAIKTAVEINPHKRHQEVPEFSRDLQQPNPIYSNRVLPLLDQRRSYQALERGSVYSAVYRDVPELPKDIAEGRGL